MADPNSIGGTGQTFGPVLTPAENVPKNSYRAIYPDYIWPAATLLVAAVPFFFAPTTLVAPAFNPALIAADLICAPSQIARAPVNQTTRLGAVTPQLPLIVAVYPDRVAAPFLPLPPYFFSPITQPVTGFDPATIAGDLVVAPAEVRRFSPNMTSRSEGAFARPARDAWLAVYPDAIPPPSPIPARAPAVFWSTFTPTGVVTPTGWAPYYPDWLPRPALQQSWYASPPPPPDTSRLGWRGTQPAWNERRDSFPQGWLTKPPEAPDVTRFGWRGSYPDWLPPNRLVPQGWYVKPPEAPDVRSFQWRGSYPDRIDRFDPFPQGWYAKPVAAPPVDTFAWRPVYPDWLPPLPRQYPEPWLDPFARPAAIQLGWGATYPDWLPPLRLVPQGWWAGPTQNPQLVALSWSPEYPDFARSLRIIEPSVSYVQPVVAQVYGWDPIYPSAFPPRPVDPGWLALHPQPTVSFAWFQLPADVVRLPLVLPGIYVRPPQEPPDIARYAWRPDYPDLHWSPRSAAFPSGVLDVFPRPPVLTVFGWYAIYPNFLPPPLLVPTGQLVSIIEPIAPVIVVARAPAFGIGQPKAFSSDNLIGGGGSL